MRIGSEGRLTDCAAGRGLLRTTKSWKVDFHVGRVKIGLTQDHLLHKCSITLILDHNCLSSRQSRDREKARDNENRFVVVALAASEAPTHLSSSNTPFNFALQACIQDKIIEIK